MTPEQLKASILQIAIQGKLVEQRPEEGSTEEYLYKVTKELKNTRRVVEDEEKFIDIPSTWSWACLSDVTTDEYINDGNWILSKDMVVEGDVKLIQLGSIGDNIYKNKGFKYLTQEHFRELNGRQIYPGYLLVNRLIGDKMLSCILPELDGILMTAVDVCWIAPHENCYDIKFIMYALSSSLFQEKVKELGRGTTRFRISKLNLMNIAFPLPPLEEQHRIVAKIEELLPFVDRYAASYEKLEQFNAKFPEDMKKSILQYAIQGKLVEQRPEEGIAEDLYKSIQEAKQKLIKEGKIKKGKPLAVIAEDEIPFDIPDSWKWIRVSSICKIINGDRGKNYPSKATLKKEGIPFISALNLDGKTVKKDDNLLCLSEEQYNKLGSGKLDKGDIVVCIRGSLGKHGRYPFEKGAIASSLVICRQYCNEDVLADFFMMYLDAPLFYSLIKKYDNGTAQPNLSAKSFEEFLFPLPPLEEQKRIVSKIEELLPYCDQLIK